MNAKTGGRPAEYGGGGGGARNARLGLMALAAGAQERRPGAPPRVSAHCTGKRRFPLVVNSGVSCEARVDFGPAARHQASARGGVFVLGRGQRGRGQEGATAGGRSCRDIDGNEIPASRLRDELWRAVHNGVNHDGLIPGGETDGRGRAESVWKDESERRGRGRKEAPGDRRVKLGHSPAGAPLVELQISPTPRPGCWFLGE